MRASPPLREASGSREAAFLLCSFWLADCYAVMGRRDEAHALCERLSGFGNDLGR